jgi:hypothetical protein
MVRNIPTLGQGSTRKTSGSTPLGWSMSLKGHVRWEEIKINMKIKNWFIQIIWNILRIKQHSISNHLLKQLPKYQRNNFIEKLNWGKSKWVGIWKRLFRIWKERRKIERILEKFRYSIRSKRWFRDSKQIFCSLMRAKSNLKEVPLSFRLLNLRAANLFKVVSKTPLRN